MKNFSEESPSKLSSTSSGVVTILLVEDEENLREGLASLLQKHGYTVYAAATGKQALELFELHAKSIQLLLTDIVLPEIGGVELATQLMARGCKDLRILFMSGYADDALQKSGIENFAVHAFIEKPFGINTFLTKVKDVLSKK